VVGFSPQQAPKTNRLPSGVLNSTVKIYSPVSATSLKVAVQTVRHFRTFIWQPRCQSGMVIRVQVWIERNQGFITSGVLSSCLLVFALRQLLEENLEFIIHPLQNLDHWESAFEQGRHFQVHSAALRKSPIR
jgi:hypothetical protein